MSAEASDLESQEMESQLEELDFADDLPPPPPEAAPKLRMTVSAPVESGSSPLDLEAALGGGGDSGGSAGAVASQLARSASDDVVYRPPRTAPPQRSRIPSFIRSASKGLTSTLPSLFSRMSSVRDAAAGVVALSVNEQFYCQICMCNEDRKEGFVLPCEHTFCRDCLSQYLTVKIKDAQVEVFKCPHLDDKEMGARGEGWHCVACSFFNEGQPAAGTTRVRCTMCETEQDAPPPEEPGCPHLIDDMNLEALLDEETWGKLQRFREMKENRHYRECPRCQHPNTEGPGRGGSNALVCGQCGHAYCYVHSDAHPDRSCRQYERERRAEERAAAAHIAQFTRPCPGCKQPIEKSTGCNHMTCPSCRTNFCWLCGRKIGDDTYPAHYAPWNLAGCPNMQMQEDAREGMTNREAQCRACVWRVAYCPLGICALLLGLALFFTILGLGIAWTAGIGSVCYLVCLPILFVAWHTVAKPCFDQDFDDYREYLHACLYMPLLPCGVFFAVLGGSD